MPEGGGGGKTVGSVEGNSGRFMARKRQKLAQSGEHKVKNQIEPCTLCACLCVCI